MRVRNLPLLAALLLPAGAAHAQAPDSTYASAALARLAGRLAADASLPDSLRHFTGDQLIAKEAMNALPLLDDVAIVGFMRLLAASLHALPEPECGSYLTAGNQGTDPEQMLPSLPAPLVDQWVGLAEALVRARAAPRRGTAATAEEVRAWNMGLMTRLAADDRDRLVTIAQHPPPSQGDACWAIRIIMDDLAAAPPATLAPITRAMFGQ